MHKAENYLSQMQSTYKYITENDLYGKAHVVT